MSEVTPKAAKTNKRVGRTASKEVRRRQLIEATIESISKYGISGTTMTTVTGFAGLSLGIVNFHFKNKENLFEETLRHLANEHRDQWRRSMKTAGMTPMAKLLSIVDAHFHPSICNRKKLAVWFGFYGEAAYRASYRKTMTEIDDERWDISSNLCKQIIAEHGYDGVTPEHVSDTLEGLYDGFCLNILIYPGEFSRQNAKSRVHDYLASVFPNSIDAPATPACEG
ncbi:MAG: TetR family transcriptional regulator C-terminal domain-containing protein [Roseovarius sp.]